MNALALDRKFTYNDYLQLEDQNRYEVLKGNLTMVPAPFTIHQLVSRNLETALWNFVRERKLGQIFDAPTDVVLADDVVVQPDILFIGKANLSLIKENAIMGPPDLIVEIVSPSSASYDAIEKRAIYEQYGVKEFWLIFPLEKTVEILTLENNIYKTWRSAKKAGSIQSKVVEEFTIDLKDIFEI